jgi:tetratricopeptide (TPR) repeat protein
MQIGPEFLARLSEHLRELRIRSGCRLLDSVELELPRLESSAAYAPQLLLQIAQWIDVGYRDYRLLDLLLERFPASARQQMPFSSFVSLRMVDAFRALAVEDADRAIELLDFVIKADTDANDSELLSLAHFWKGRAHRKKGEYEVALGHIVAARRHGESHANSEAIVAVVRIQEAWLLFQMGQQRDALKLLDAAEAILAKTDYTLALGNIQSARGRIVRRGGEYTRALDHFERAIAIYSQGHLDHRNLARALVNAAYTKRLLALQLRKRMESRGKGAHRAGLNARYVEIYRDAVKQLKQAENIYALHDYHSGSGAALLNAGHLHLDSGDVDRATEEADRAYQLALQKNDHILMARARILRASAENAHVDEQLGEDVDSAARANSAMQFAEEAVTLARDTQNRRLLAGALITRGMTASNDFFRDWALAKLCVTEVEALIGANDGDHLLEEFAELKGRVLHASGIDDTLRSWSEGIVGDRTFQQVTEEFAEIVIPKVWVKEDRKVSRVATKLSISPKKVRRILRKAGLLQRRSSR